MKLAEVTQDMSILWSLPLTLFIFWHWYTYYTNFIDIYIFEMFSYYVLQQFPSDKLL